MTSTLRNARQLARYRQWADQLTFDAVAALPPGEAAKERPTLFKTMIGTLNHNHLIDLVWQAHLEGRDHGFQARNVVLHKDLSELWKAQQSINRWYIDWSDRQSGQSLDETVHFKFIGGEPGAMTRSDILQHVVAHSTYHRGWIAEMFFQVPARNPTTDLPVYLRSLGPTAAGSS
ncbi:DinB family protein [Reyranella sp.]|uniref:DinB family protein n=1 Tax=Reyranella sp. TaxID=1929291 RepID=UPI0037836C72